MEYIVLNNGTKCLFHYMPNTHSVTIGLYLRAGQAYNEPKRGITHLLEHMYFRQMKEIYQNEIYYRMESIGGTLKATTYRDSLVFSMKIAPCYFEKGLSIFADLINTDYWTEESFEQEKQVVLNQIEEKGNYVSLDKKSRRVIFGNHPLAFDIMGTKKQLNDITLGDVMNYRDVLFTPSNLLICITGNPARKDIDETICSLLNYNSFHAENSCYGKFVHIPDAFHKRKPDVLLLHIPDNNPLEVCISFDISCSKNMRDYLMILNCILGEGVGSRLQKKVREQYTYSANIESHIEWYRDFAVLQITFSVNKCNLMRCMNAVANVIEQTKYNISKNDLDTSLPFYTTNLMFHEDDTEEMNFQQAYHQLVFQSEYQAPSIISSKETIEKIQGLANNIFTPNNCCVTILGNVKGIADEAVSAVINKLKGQGDGSLSSEESE